MVIKAMRNLTVGVFENLEIISPTDVDKRLAYTQIILRGSAQLAKELAGEEWNIGELAGLFEEAL